MQEYYLDSRQGIKSLGFVFGLRALDGKDRVPLLSEQRSPMTGYPVVALLEGIAGRRERRCEGGSVSFSTIYSPRVKCIGSHPIFYAYFLAFSPYASPTCQVESIGIAACSIPTTTFSYEHCRIFESIPGSRLNFAVTHVNTRLHEDSTAVIGQPRANNDRVNASLRGLFFLSWL